MTIEHFSFHQCEDFGHLMTVTITPRARPQDSSTVELLIGQFSTDSVVGGTYLLRKAKVASCARVVSLCATMRQINQTIVFQCMTHIETTIAAIAAHPAGFPGLQGEGEREHGAALQDRRDPGSGG